MRVLMTTDTIGGVWTFTKELAVGLLAQRCVVALVSVGRAPSQEQLDWAAEIAVRFGKDFYFIALDTPLEWMQDNPNAFSGTESTLRRLVKEINPDVFLSSQYCFGALEIDVPLIVVAHSDVLSWARACRNQPLEPSPWLDQYCSLVRRGLLQADAVVAPTRWMLDALAMGFPIPSRQFVIPNGRTIPPAPAHLPRRLHAVTAGRLWDEAKNLKFLEDMDLRVPLIIAGALLNDSSEYSLTAQTNALGQLTENALLALFRQCAFYICPSLYEPFGLAPLEAALCGCAVVLNDIPSLREVWGDSALYFQGADSLACLVDKLATNVNSLVKWQAHSLQRARQFTAERMVTSYLGLFKSLSSRVEAAQLAV